MCTSYTVFRHVWRERANYLKMFSFAVLHNLCLNIQWATKVQNRKRGNCLHSSSISQKIMLTEQLYCNKLNPKDSKNATVVNRFTGERNMNDGMIDPWLGRKYEWTIIIHMISSHTFTSGPPRSRRAMECRERGPTPLQVHVRPRAVRECRGRRVSPRRRGQPGHLGALRVRRRQRRRVHGCHGEREHSEGWAKKHYNLSLQNILVPQHTLSRWIWRRWRGSILATTRRSFRRPYSIQRSVENMDSCMQL